MQGICNCMVRGLPEGGDTQSPSSTYSRYAWVWWNERSRANGKDEDPLFIALKKKKIVYLNKSVSHSKEKNKEIKAYVICRYGKNVMSYLNDRGWETAV